MAGGGLFDAEERGDDCDREWGEEEPFIEFVWVQGYRYRSRCAAFFFCRSTQCIFLSAD